MHPKRLNRAMQSSNKILDSVRNLAISIKEFKQDLGNGKSKKRKMGLNIMSRGIKNKTRIGMGNE